MPPSTTIRVVTRASLDSGGVRSDDLAYVDRLENTYAHLLGDEPLPRSAPGGTGSRHAAGCVRRARRQHGTHGDRRGGLVAGAGCANRQWRSRGPASAGSGSESADRRDRRRPLRRRELPSSSRSLPTSGSCCRDSRPTPGAGDAELLQLGESVRLREVSIIGQRSEFERNRLARDERASTLAIIEPARLPTGRSSPNVVLYLAIGLIRRRGRGRRAGVSRREPSTAATDTPGCRGSLGPQRGH